MSFAEHLKSSWNDLEGEAATRAASRVALASLNVERDGCLDTITLFGRV
jgi:hypothetical protein